MPTIRHSENLVTSLFNKMYTELATLWYIFNAEVHKACCTRSVALVPNRGFGLRMGDCHFTQRFSILFTLHWRTVRDFRMAALTE